MRTLAKICDCPRRFLSPKGSSTISKAVPKGIVPIKFSSLVLVGIPASAGDLERMLSAAVDINL